MTDEHSSIEELDNGTYIEFTLSYDDSILLPVSTGTEMIKLLADSIHLKRRYNKPPEIMLSAEYPAFKFTTGASIKAARLTALLEKE